MTLFFETEGSPSLVQEWVVYRVINSQILNFLKVSNEKKVSVISFRKSGLTMDWFKNEFIGYKALTPLRQEWANLPVEPFSFFTNF